MTKDSSPLPLAISMGDAAGVGPELCLHLIANWRSITTLSGRPVVPVIVGSAALLKRVAETIKKPCDIPVVSTLEGVAPAGPMLLEPAGMPDLSGIQPGSNQAPCGAASALCVEVAVLECLAGKVAGMTTAPISKKSWQLAGVNYPGHTEMLAALTGVSSQVMFFYSSEMRCVFVTSHTPLRSVPDLLTVDRIVATARMAWESVVAMDALPRPLCMLALNPHAGEEGLFGDEEKRILQPAKQAIVRLGIPIEGPAVPDTAFFPETRKRYSCYLAMYHDQGCIPFKLLAFDSGVNATMGLPIIRTSPDHGTAYDLAWKGKVRPASFMAACVLAARLADLKQRKNRA